MSQSTLVSKAKRPTSSRAVKAVKVVSRDKSTLRKKYIDA